MTEQTDKPKEGSFYCPGCGHQYFDHKTGTEKSEPGAICKYCIGTPPKPPSKELQNGMLG